MRFPFLEHLRNPDRRKHTVGSDKRIVGESPGQHSGHSRFDALYLSGRERSRDTSAGSNRSAPCLMAVAMGLAPPYEAAPVATAASAGMLMRSLSASMASWMP